MDQNNCHQLEISMEEAPQFDELLNMQKQLQLRINPDYCNPNNSIAEVADFFFKNKHALEEELCETMNALGGTHDPLKGTDIFLGSAAWKWWKKNHKLATTHTLKDLSDRDILELKMEIVDQFHFIMNEMVLINMTGSELYSMYKSKNAENFNRQENGY